MSVAELKERHIAATETLSSLKERLRERRLQLLDTDVASYARAQGKTPVALGPTDLVCCRILQGHTGKVYSLDWTPEKNRIVSASQDGRLIVWNALTSQKTHAIKLPCAWVMACAFSPSGQSVACGGLDSVCSIFNLSTPLDKDGNMPVSRMLSGHKGYVSSCQYVPDDDTRLITGSGDQTCVLWDITTGLRASVFGGEFQSGHTADVLSVSINGSNSRMFVSGSCDATARLWDTRVASRAVRTFHGHEGDVNSVKFFPDGNRFGTGSDDGTCRLYDIRTGHQLQVYSHPNQEDNNNNINTPTTVTSIAFSISGRLLFSSYSNGDCFVWDTLLAERVFLFKFLCDEVLNSGVVRNNISPDSGDSEKKLRQLYKELKSQNKKEKEKESEDTCQEESTSFPKSSDSQSQSQLKNEENDENKQAGPTKTPQGQESGPGVSSLQEKIATLESKITKPVVRRDFLGRDLVGRLYWILSSPERVVVSGPHSHRSEGEMTKMPEMFDNDSLWTCYESDTEIQKLIGWLRDDDTKEKELKETIRHWHINRVNDVNAPENHPQIVEYNNNPMYITKAREALEKKFGSCSKKNSRKSKGKMVKNGKLYRCECLELVGPTRHHCSSCHWTFLTKEELEGHNDGKCQNRQECEGPTKGKKVSLVKPQGLTLTDYREEPDLPFVFEEIRAKFCTRSSLKEEVNDIGLIGSNGAPSLVYPQDNNSGLFSISETEKLVDSQNGSKVERSKPKGVSGKSLLKNKSLVRICQSSLKPLTGRVLEILKCLKINLFDMETALLEDSLRPSRGGVDRLRAWRTSVKSAQSIYEMVQATIMLEDMIKTEYLRKEWWYWSSPSTAAKISNISALALRIYALDAAIYYEKPPTSNLDSTEPLTPKSCKPEKKTSEKSTAKDSSEKSTPKNSQRSSSSPVPEGSRPKTRSKKRTRDSEVDKVS